MGKIFLLLSFLCAAEEYLKSHCLLLLCFVKFVWNEERRCKKKATEGLETLIINKWRRKRKTVDLIRLSILAQCRVERLINPANWGLWTLVWFFLEDWVWSPEIDSLSSGLVPHLCKSQSSLMAGFGAAFSVRLVLSVRSLLWSALSRESRLKGP